MKVLILGAGRLGSRISEVLSKEYEVAVADKSRERLESLGDEIRKIALDASEHWSLVRSLERYDAVINALPDSLSIWTMRACMKAKKILLDLSLESPLYPGIFSECKRRGSLILLDAGFSPGISNFLVGASFQEGEELRIFHGDLPKSPSPPCFHSFEDLRSARFSLHEYSRKAKAIVDRKEALLDPLSPFPFRDFGMNLEAAPADRLRSLIKIGAKTAIFFSLRWPGHFKKMRALRDLGFLSKEEISHTLKVISKASIGRVDLSLLKVELGEDPPYSIIYESRSGSASSEAAAISSSIFLDLIFSLDLPSGVYFPEDLGRIVGDPSEVLSSLSSYGMTIKEGKRQEVIA